ncbi:MAG TPA: hypothetical protein VHN74_13425 [Candidatus Angelobacter sp.]|jgi:hypothetical protein|nr:hypothetical protein [Candidatus Angelobacter sp.]
MFARRLQVLYPSDTGLQPCPLKWLDNFAMRNFTNDPIFDDTLPVADGIIEVGSRVPLARLKESMEDWFRRKSYLSAGTQLVIEEQIK